MCNYFSLLFLLGLSVSVTSCFLSCHICTWKEIASFKYFNWGHHTYWDLCVSPQWNYLSPQMRQLSTSVTGEKENT